MSNARFSILQARAISDKRISDAQFRTLAALGMYADKEGWCFPSLTRIGADCNKKKQVAGRDIVHLKKCGYVEVYPQFDEKGGRRVNKYRLIFDPPVITQYTPPSPPEGDTPSSSEGDVNVPYNAQKESKKKELNNLSIENSIATNQPVTEEVFVEANIRDIAPKMFEKALGFSKPLPWWSNKEWTAFAEWVIERHRESPTCFGEYNIWRNEKYTKGGISNNRIRGFVVEFYDSWDMFRMSKPQKTDQPSPTSLLRTLS